MNPEWGYMAMIDRLTNGDITKQDEVFRLPWLQCLTYLLYLKDKDHWVEQMNKIEEGKIKPKNNIRYGNASY